MATTFSPSGERADLSPVAHPHPEEGALMPAASLQTDAASHHRCVYSFYAVLYARKLVQF